MATNAKRSHTEPRQRVGKPRMSNLDESLLNNWRENLLSNAPAKKDNSTREREAGLSQGSTPTSQMRRHTPHSFPRTTAASHINALEALKQRLVFQPDSAQGGDAMSESEDGTLSQDSGVQDATSTADSNQIVGRLMQIRDYLKQASDMKQSLDKDSISLSHPFGSRDQFSRLTNLIDHLREQEDAYLQLLQKMLNERSSGGMRDSVALSTSRAVQSSPSLNGFSAAAADVTPVDSDVEQSEDELLEVENASQASDCTTDKEAEVQALREQRDLLKKMLEQQRTLKELHERQAHLLELKKQSEGQLSQATDEDKDQDEQATTQVNGSLLVRDAESDGGETTEEESELEEGEIRADDSIAAAEDGMIPDSLLMDGDDAVPPELAALREKLVYLKNLFDDNLNNQLDDERKLNTLKELQKAAEQSKNPSVKQFDESEISNQSDEEESELSSSERRQLSNKLSQLQEKKEKMEELLNELQALRELRKDDLSKAPVDGMSDSSEVTSTSTMSALVRGVDQARAAEQTVGQAETLLDVMQQESKIRKLGAVKERLDTLREMIQLYQSGNINQSDDDSRRSSVQSENDLSLLGNVRRAQQAAQANDTTSDTESQTSASSCSSSKSSQLRNDPEYQEKIQQLEAAKQRLAQLQALVSVVQSFPDSQGALPDELAELAGNLMAESEIDTDHEELENASILSQASTSSGAQAFAELYEVARAQSNHNTSNNRKSKQKGVVSKSLRLQKSNNQKVAAVSDDDKESQATTSVLDSEEEYYRQKMVEQKSQLDGLRDERNRLMRIQEELRQLHTNYRQQQDEVERMDSQTKSTRIQSDSTVANKPTKASSSTGVTFSSHLPEKSNEEIYQNMRAQRVKMMAEGRRNLNADDQATVDVTTVATWGESQDGSSSTTTTSEDESDTSEDSDEDGEGKENASGDDDGYPSDGILPVEEEEEAVDSDKDTYTVEEDYSKRQRYPKSRSAPNPAGGDYRAVPSGGLAPNKSRTRGVDMIAKMKSQLDATTELCQQVAKQQQQLQGLRGVTPDSGERMGNLVETRLVYSVNQLYSQVMDMQAALQVTVDQVYAITQHLDLQQDETRSQSTIRGDNAVRDSQTLRGAPTKSEALRDSELRLDAARLGLPSWARPTSATLAGRPPSRRAPGARSLYTGRDEILDAVPSSNQIDPTRLINSASNQRSASGRLIDADQNYTVPPLDLDKLIKRRQDCTKSLSASGRSFPSPSLSAIAAGRMRVPAEFSSKPGVSAGISGTAFVDTASLSSALSTFREVSSAEATPTQTPDGTPDKPTRSLSRPGRTQAVGNQHANSGRDDTGSEFSLFEALRETIYSEVATLISQNENRPHFLIELFRELQMLSSDYLRQRALFSVQELVTKFLTDETFGINTGEGGVINGEILTETEEEGPLAPRPAWMLYQASASEQTPSESYVTTDEEDSARQPLVKHNMTPSNSQALLGGSGGFYPSAIGSIRSDLADYIEQVETTSTQSTPQSLTGTWDDPFNQDGLGDTVIHLDQAMQKVREIDRLKEAERAARKTSSVTSSSAQGSRSVSARGSTQGSRPGSANSRRSDLDDISESQGTRIDTQALDRQIKSVMNEIIPVLKEHMENVCSTQLLTYLQNRILQFVIVSGDSKGQATEEFTQFFETQLANILRDSLTKFTGRRLRECGEEILVDVSEILFNELAFFKLMQELDDPETRGRIAASKYRVGRNYISRDDSTVSTENDVEVISGAGDFDETADSSESETSEETGEESERGEDGEREEYQTEEENLGKERDDAFADEINVNRSNHTAAPFEGGPVENQNDIRYSLAPSETKPMTRIGSDEDCTEDETSSDVSSDSGDDTAISRQAANDENTSPRERDDNRGGEITVEDLPSSFTSKPERIAETVNQEQSSNSLIREIADAATDELAGNPMELKPPSSGSLPADPTEGAARAAGDGSGDAIFDGDQDKDDNDVSKDEETEKELTDSQRGI